MLNKTILLTGATGFIGSWLLKKLLALDSKVVIIVRDKTKISKDLLKSKNLKIYEATIQDYDSICQIIKNNNFDLIFHLASKNTNYGNNFDILETFDTIIKGTYNIFEACRLHGQKKLKIILTSSREVYAEKNEDNFDSNSYHPYEISKRSVDLIVKSYNQIFGLNIISVRPPNIYGGNDYNWDRIVPGTIKSIINGERPIIRTNGSLLRSYLYIEDFITAMILIAEKGIINNDSNNIYDFDELELYSTLEIVEKIISISGNNLEPKIENLSKDEKFKIEPNIQYSIKVLGWNPLYSTDKGLKKTIDWYNNNIVPTQKS